MTTSMKVCMNEWGITTVSQPVQQWAATLAAWTREARASWSLPGIPYHHCVPGRHARHPLPPRPTARSDSSRSYMAGPSLWTNALPWHSINNSIAQRLVLRLLDKYLCICKCCGIVMCSSGWILNICHDREDSNHRIVHCPCPISAGGTRSAVGRAVRPKRWTRPWSRSSWPRMRSRRSSGRVPNTPFFAAVARYWCLRGVRRAPRPRAGYPAATLWLRSSPRCRPGGTTSLSATDLFYKSEQHGRAISDTVLWKIRRLGIPLNKVWGVVEKEGHPVLLPGVSVGIQKNFLRTQVELHAVWS